MTQQFTFQVTITADPEDLRRLQRFPPDDKTSVELAKDVVLDAMADKDEEIRELIGNVISYSVQ